ncbi:MAG TPA: regulatory protein RecX, partial [Candidatus Limnocylindria bacterium]|nr:regulatory protein RecX [Candidatus Limnocylindria bacterium]
RSMSQPPPARGRPGGRRRPRDEPREPPDVPAAIEIAARLLATRPRSRWEVQRRLRRAGAQDAVISAALERLAALGYVDDTEFVRWWQEQRDRHAPRGRRMIAAELRQRGVPRDVLDGLDEDAEERTARLGEPDADLPGTEEERADVALERHLRGRPLPEDRAGLQRIGMFLVRRGFDPEAARGAIRRRQQERDEPDATEE